MKKIISMLMALMLFSTTAFADASQEIAELYEKSMQLSSVSAKMIMETELNEPLDIFDSIPEEYLSDDVDIDVKMIAQSLTEAKAIAEYDTYISEDYKKMKLAMSMEYDIPVRMNSEFSIEAMTKFGMWFDCDISDAENPLFRVIYKIPFMKKYMVIDMSEQYKKNPELISVLEKEKIKEINKKSSEILTKNADISKKEDEYIIKFTDETAKKYIYDYFTLSKEIMPKELAEDKNFNDMISAVKDFGEKVTIFGEDGLTIRMTKNASGYITAQEINSHININVYDALTYFSKNTDGLDRDNAFINITCKAATELNNHNGVTPQFPVLTEENSVKQEIGVAEFESMSYESPSAPLLRNDLIYYPVEKMLEKYGFGLTYDGKILSSKQGEKMVTVSVEADEVIVESDILYCTEDIVNKLKMDVYNIRYDFDKNNMTFTYMRMYEPEVSEENEVVQENDYIVPALMYHFYLDRMPYEKDGVVYMPVYEFAEALFEGEFSFAENALSYTAKENNVLGISTITAHKGDGFVTINGGQKWLDYPVEENDGILYIPLSFAQSLGFEVSVDAVYRAYNGSSADYYLSIANPEYKPEIYETDYEEEIYDYFHVESDRLPYMANDTVYIPAFDLFNKFLRGEYTFSENGFELRTTNKNELGIETISVCAGDKFITINGEKKELSQEIVNIDSVVRLPISVVTYFGMKITNISVWGGGTEYFVEKETSENKSGRNWFSNLFGF